MVLCLNTRCDSNSICNHYSEDATSEQRDRFIVNPCIQCNSFLDNREKEDPVENSELEAY